MQFDLVTSVFWLGAAAVGYSTISASIRHVHHWRRGANILAAEAALQAVVCTLGLGTFWAVYLTYLSG
jgi:predicted signal transduction protein with EAL and GGDEF domain